MFNIEIDFNRRQKFGFTRASETHVSMVEQWCRFPACPEIAMSCCRKTYPHTKRQHFVVLGARLASITRHVLYKTGAAYRAGGGCFVFDIGDRRLTVEVEKEIAALLKLFETFRLSWQKYLVYLLVRCKYNIFLMFFFYHLLLYANRKPIVA